MEDTTCSALQLPERRSSAGQGFGAEAAARDRDTDFLEDFGAKLVHDLDL